MGRAYENDSDNRLKTCQSSVCVGTCLIIPTPAIDRRARGPYRVLPTRKWHEDLRGVVERSLVVGSSLFSLLRFHLQCGIHNRATAIYAHSLSVRHVHVASIRPLSHPAGEAIIEPYLRHRSNIGTPFHLQREGQLTS